MNSEDRRFSRYDEQGRVKRRPAPAGNRPAGDRPSENGQRESRPAQTYKGGAGPEGRGRADGRSGRGMRKRRRVWPIVLGVLLLVLLGGATLLYARIGMSLDREKLKDILVNTGIDNTGGYQNIALYGVDSREGQLTKECHSDTIMICSINKRTKEVKLVSVYRDTYLDNTNGEYRKATECYYFGGPERSINMLNKNLDLDITDYITVNFGAVIDIVDAVGGIDLDITQEEMEYINGYCVETSAVTGVGYEPLNSWGQVHLDGIHAMAYCRIRYTQGWDFKRTERQRQVLSLVYQKARQRGPAALIPIVNAILPEISTSMSSAQLISLATALPSFTVGEQSGFPFDQVPTVVEGSDVVVPQTLSSNVSRLHEVLFGQTGYTPSATVQAISEEIAARSGIY